MQRQINFAIDYDETLGVLNQPIILRRTMLSKEYKLETDDKVNFF